MTRAIGGDEILVLIGGAEPASPMTWARAGADGAVLERGEGDPPAAPPARTVLVLPGAEAQTRRLELPARTEAQARGAAAILFEGDLAGEEDMHCAVGEAQDESGHRLAAAISAARFGEWLARCRAYGAEPDFVTLDFMLRPVEAGEVEIFEADGRTLVAGGAIGGFAIETAFAPALFPRWLDQAGVRPSVVYYAGPNPKAWRAVVPGLKDRGAADSTAALAAGAAAPPALAVNLRQGAFAPASDKPTTWRLKLAVLLAIVLGLLQIGGQVVAGWRDAEAARRILATAEQDFRAARPEVRRIVNLRAQSAALVNAMQQSQGHPVIAVTEPLIKALQSQPLARVEDLAHEAPGRAVRVRLSAPQAAILEQVSASLRGAGMRVEAREMSPLAGRYASELILEAAP